jgi:hypothetical protein
MTQYWINTGKRMHGPFTASQLKRLAEKGKLKPTHKISVDQKRWVPAESVDGLNFHIEQPQVPDIGDLLDKSDADEYLLAQQPKQTTDNHSAMPHTQPLPRHQRGRANPDSADSDESNPVVVAAAIGGSLLIGLAILVPLLWVSSSNKDAQMEDASEEQTLVKTSQATEAYDQFFRLVDDLPALDRALTAGKIAPGPIEWEAEFAGCSNLGRLTFSRPATRNSARLRSPTDYSLSVAIRAAPDALPDWLSVPPGTKVRFAAQLRDEFITEFHDGASVLPKSYRIYEKGLTRIRDGAIAGFSVGKTGTMNSSGKMTHAKGELLVYDARPLIENPLSKQQAAAKLLDHWAEHFGASVTKDDQGRTRAFSHVQVREEKVLPPRNGLHLCPKGRRPWRELDRYFGDAEFALLVSLPDLISITLLSDRLTNKSLEIAAKCPSLSRLWLFQAKIDDAGLASLSDCKNLRSLSLTFTDKITDSAVVHLQTLTSLENLILEETAVTHGALKELQQYLPNTIIAGLDGVAPEDWQVTRRLDNQDHATLAMVFGDPPRLLAIASAATDGRKVTGSNVRVWNTDSGALVREWSEPGMAVHDLAFSPDNTTLLAVGAILPAFRERLGKPIRAWRLPSGVPDEEISRQVSATNADVIYAVRFEDNGQVRLTTDASERDLTSWRHIELPNGKSCVEIDDGQVKFKTIESGRVDHTVSLGDDTPIRLAIGTDGKLLAIATREGHVYIAGTLQ